MTIHEIYDAHCAGSVGFCMRVETHCGLEISRDEIERIADHAHDADDFMRIWEHEEWWRDAQ